MNKKILSFVLLIGLILIGCEEKVKESSTSPFIGGSKGIVAEFQDMGVRNENTGQNEIFEGETFPIEVRVMNKGEHDVEAGELVLSLMGINFDDFDNLAGEGTDDEGILSNTATIERVSEFNTDGGETELDFTPGTVDALYNLNLTGSSYNVNLFASVVYDYTTYVAVPKVCYSGDPINTEVCNIEEVKDVFSSAAPIQVKKAEEMRAGIGVIAVEFDVENVGNGQVTRQGEDFDSRYDQFSFSATDNNWECTSGGKDYGRFDSSGKAKIRCKLIDTAKLEKTDPVYTKELDLELDYRYKEIIQDSVRILKV